MSAAPVKFRQRLMRSPLIGKNVEPKVTAVVREGGEVSRGWHPRRGSIPRLLRPRTPGVQRVLAYEAGSGQPEAVAGSWSPASASWKTRIGIHTPSARKMAPDGGPRAVKQWRLQQLTTVKRQAHLDPVTEFYVLAWDAFQSARSSRPTKR